MVNRTQEVRSGTPCNYKQREYDQKTIVHVFSKQTIHNMLLGFLIVIMKPLRPVITSHYMPCSDVHTRN